MVQVAVSGRLLNRYMTRLCEGLYRDVHFHGPFPERLIVPQTASIAMREMYKLHRVALSYCIQRAQHTNSVSFCIQYQSSHSSPRFCQFHRYHPSRPLSYFFSEPEFICSVLHASLVLQSLTFRTQDIHIHMLIQFIQMLLVVLNLLPQLLKLLLLFLTNVEILVGLLAFAEGVPVSSRYVSINTQHSCGNPRKMLPEQK